MELTNSSPPSQPRSPENIQFSNLVDEFIHAKKDGSLEEKIKSSKDLLDFIEHDTLKGLSKEAVGICMRHAAKRSFDSYTSQLIMPRTVNVAPIRSSSPPCPAFPR
jgi:hypothetical protein